MIHINFELGLFNIYIFLIVYLIITNLSFINRKRNRAKEPSERKIKRDNFSRVTYILSSIMFALVIIISFFLPIDFNSILFYLGLFLWAIGIIIVSSTSMSWIKTPENKLVTIGMYKYSRNPMYISFFFTYIGIGLISNSWIFLIITFVYIMIIMLEVKNEEKLCLKKYGDKYKNYMKKTPRWIGLKKK